MIGCPLVATNAWDHRGQVLGLCGWCGEDLPLTKSGKINPYRRWCSTECSDAYWSNHSWQSARAAALKRDDYRCVKCGDDAGTTRKCSFWLCQRPWPCDKVGVEETIRGHGKPVVRRHDVVVVVGNLEVNHIEPRKGGGYNNGCAHHLDGLETLCHPCHVEVTKAQLREWRPPREKRPERGTRSDRPPEAASLPLWD